MKLVVAPQSLGVQALGVQAYQGFPQGEGDGHWVIPLSRGEILKNCIVAVRINEK